MTTCLGLSFCLLPLPANFPRLHNLQLNPTLTASSLRKRYASSFKTFHHPRTALACANSGDKQELLTIQQEGPRKIGFVGSQNMEFMHQELIEMLSHALVMKKHHIFTSGGSGTNSAVIRGALCAQNPELLTVILPQSLSMQSEESQELLSRVKYVIEKPSNDNLPFMEARSGWFAVVEEKLVLQSNAVDRMQTDIGCVTWTSSLK